MSRFAGPIAGAAIAALAALGFRYTHLPPSPGAATVTTANSQATAVPRDPAGDTLWRQSLRAAGPQGTPIKAHVTITRSSGNDSDNTEFDLWDGGGRYRLAYTAPQSARGRIVVCDGKMLWQYEPLRHTVLRRVVPLNSPTSPLEETALPTGVIAEVEDEEAFAAGRPAQILTFRDAKGKLLGRRWLDDATGRNLRTETYDPQTGKRLVQVTLNQFQPLVNSPTDLFKPNFPETARVLKAGAPRLANLATAAGHVGLPLTAGTYRLRSVFRARSGSHPIGFESSDHLIYTNGVETVSVFVTTKAVESATLRPNARWQPVTIAPGISGFVHTDRQGRTAIAWIRGGKRCVALSRLPQSELIAMVHGLTAAR